MFRCFLIYLDNKMWKAPTISSVSFKCLILSNNQHSKALKYIELKLCKITESCKSSHLRTWNKKIFAIFVSFQLCFHVAFLQKVQCEAQHQTGKHFGCHERSNQPVKTTRQVKQLWQNTHSDFVRYDRMAQPSQPGRITHWTSRYKRRLRRRHLTTETSRFVPVCPSRQLEIKMWSLSQNPH